MFTVSDIEEGIHGQPKITLRSPDEAHLCDIYIYGATVTAWRHAGVEKLFCSPVTPFDGVCAIRGGIPVVFPQFGRPNEIMPQHGFARTSMWTIDNIKTDETSCTVQFSLKESESTLAVWPHAFALQYTVILSTQGLRTTFRAANTGDAPFDCQALLHTYIAVPKIEDVLVRGLSGMAVFDKMAPVAAGAALPVEDRELAIIDREVDRIYLDPATTTDAPGDAFALGSVDVLSKATASESLETLLKVHRKAYVQDGASGSVSTLAVDCVLWNAWIAKSKAIVDLEDDAYLRYVCVEPGICSRYESVAAGHTLVLDQYLTV